MFRKHGVGVACVSNNATSTRAAYAQKFKGLGVDMPKVLVIAFVLPMLTVGLRNIYSRLVQLQLDT